MQFYADGDHFAGDEWESCDDPPNFLCDPHGGTVEDGSIAKAALADPPRYVMDEPEEE